MEELFHDVKDKRTAEYLKQYFKDDEDVVLTYLQHGTLQDKLDFVEIPASEIRGNIDYVVEDTIVNMPENIFHSKAKEYYSKLMERGIKGKKYSELVAAQEAEKPAINLTNLKNDDIIRIWHIEDMAASKENEFVKPSENTVINKTENTPMFEVAMRNEGEALWFEGDGYPEGSTEFTLQLYVNSNWEGEFIFYLTPDNEFLFDIDDFESEYSSYVDRLGVKSKKEFVVEIKDYLLDNNIGYESETDTFEELFNGIDISDFSNVKQALKRVELKIDSILIIKAEEKGIHFDFANKSYNVYVDFYNDEDSIKAELIETDGKNGNEISYDFPLDENEILAICNAIDLRLHDDLSVYALEMANKTERDM